MALGCEVNFDTSDASHGEEAGNGVMYRVGFGSAIVDEVKVYHWVFERH
jgi:hypothetical protein